MLPFKYISYDLKLGCFPLNIFDQLLIIIITNPTYNLTFLTIKEAYFQPYRNV